MKHAAFAALAVLAVAVLPAQAGTPPLAGSGTAVIDGVLAPGEWDHAATLDFDTQRPAADGGGSVATRAYVMNDAHTLYLAVHLDMPSYDAGVEAFWFFDRANDNVAQLGDDAVLVQVFRGMGVLAYDDYRAPCTPGASGPVYCTFADAPPGTSDVAAAMREGPDGLVIELSHPLASADAAHDTALGPGAVTGLTLGTGLFASCAPGDGCFAEGDPPHVSVGITPGTSLALTAKAGARRVRVGKTLSYSFALANRSTTPAAETSIEIDTPATLVVKAVRASAGTCGAGSFVTCQLGPLAPGATVRVTVVARARRPGRATLTAAAATTSYSADASPTAAASATVTRR